MAREEFLYTAMVVVARTAVYSSQSQNRLVSHCTATTKTRKSPKCADIVVGKHNCLV